MTDTLKKSIAEIPEGGWWKRGSEETFCEVAEKMLLKGFSESEIVDILEDVYAAVADCYGG